jgi:hypothetical protein
MNPKMTTASTSPVSAIESAIEMITSSQGGYIQWSDDVEIRTFCHGFLFHYEQYVKGKMNIVPGNQHCKHFDNCPYKITYHIFSLLEGLLALRSTDQDTNFVFSGPYRSTNFGCSFRHDEIDLSYLPPIVNKLSQNGLFMSKLEEIYNAPTDRKRETRLFWVSRSRDNDLEALNLHVFSDYVFRRGQAASDTLELPPSYRCMDLFPALKRCVSGEQLPDDKTEVDVDLLAQQAMMDAMLA